MAVEEVGSVKISTELDTSQLQSSLSTLEKKALSGLKIALAGATAALVKFGIDSVNTASDLSEVQNVVDTTFGDGANKIEDFAKKAKEAYGLSELSAKKYTGTMGAMLKSMGLSNDAVLEMSTDMTGLAGDFASFYNLNHEDAFNKIRAGISGETEPLKQLGINMSVANLEAYALSQGITKSFNAMTQAEQATLRYNYLMSVTADAQGDFAKTAETSLANSLRILSLEFESLSATIGADLLPVALEAVQGLTNMVQHIAEVYSEEGVEGLAESIGDLIAMLADKAAEALPKLVEIGIQIIEALIKGIITNTPAILVHIGELFMNLLAVSIAHILEWSAELGALILKCGQDIIEALWNGMKSASEWLASNVAKFLIDLSLWLGKGADMIIDFGSDVIHWIGQGIKNAYDWLMNQIAKFLVDMVKWFSDGFEDMKDAGKNLVEGLWKGLSGSVSWIKNKIKGWVGDVTSYMKKLFGIASPSKVMRDMIGVNLVKGIGVGFDKEMPALKRDIDSQLAWLSNYTAGVDLGLSTKGVNLKEKLNLAFDENSLNSTQRIVLEVDGSTLTEIVNTYNRKMNLAYGG
ncbi:MAG: hypothetical protein IKV80_08310 [Bacteroidales bacterium]|nr:hypothetical protein [Bacteroidales bacterium]